MNRVTAGIFCLSSIVLTGCADSKPACPTVVLDPAAAMVTKFAAGRAEAGAMLAEARLLTPTASCQAAGGRTIVHAAATVAADRGPGLPDNGEVDLPYTLSLRQAAADTGAPSDPVATQQGVVGVSFPGIAGHAETALSQTVELPEAQGGEPGDYRLVAGFDLTPDELQYNLARMKGAAP